MLWHQVMQSSTPFKNAHLVSEFLDIWFQTRRSSDLISCNYAGQFACVIDAIYDAQPGEGSWALVRLNPFQMRDYIKFYLKNGQKQQRMVSPKDKILYTKYKKLLDDGYRSTPIIVAGSEEDDGIYLIDGRHRIYAHCAAGKETINAYIPVRDIEMLRKAKL